MARGLFAVAALAGLGLAAAIDVPVKWDSCGTRYDRLKTSALSFSVDPSLRSGSTAHLHTSGTTDLHAPLTAGAWQVRVYEEGFDHPTYTTFGDIMQAIHFNDAKETAYTMDVSYTLPRAQKTGVFTVSLISTDQQHATYNCIEFRYNYTTDMVNFEDVDAPAVAVKNTPTVTDGPHFWSCGSSSDILSDLQVKITPATPVKGKPVTIAATGKLSTGVSGGTIKYTAALDGITLIKKTENLCDLLSHTQYKCPLKAGPAQIGITETIPSWAPGGNYSATAHATDASGAEITCLQGWFVLN